MLCALAQDDSGNFAPAGHDANTISGWRVSEQLSIGLENANAVQRVGQWMPARPFVAAPRHAAFHRRDHQVMALGFGGCGSHLFSRVSASSNYGLKRSIDRPAISAHPSHPWFGDAARQRCTDSNHSQPAHATPRAPKHCVASCGESDPSRPDAPLGSWRATTHETLAVPTAPQQYSHYAFEGEEKM